MPLELDATVGGISSNAYADVAEADEELAYRVGASAWVNEGDDEKIQDLVTAARELDTLPLRGERASPLQALEFPRTGLDANGDELPADEIPYLWWVANIELANWFAANRASGGDLLSPIPNQTKKAKSGDDEVEFFAPNAEERDAHSLSRFPAVVQRLISSFVMIEEPATGWGSAIVVRGS